MTDTQQPNPNNNLDKSRSDAQNLGNSLQTDLQTILSNLHQLGRISNGRGEEIQAEIDQAETAIQAIITEQVRLARIDEVELAQKILKGKELVNVANVFEFRITELQKEEQMGCVHQLRAACAGCKTECYACKPCICVK